MRDKACCIGDSSPGRYNFGKLVAGFSMIPASASHYSSSMWLLCSSLKTNVTEDFYSHPILNL